MSDLVHVAVVGTRTFANYALLAETLGGLAGPLAIVSGGAAGADALAERFARERGLPLAVFRADWRRHGRAAGPLRNAQIVAACDRLVAFWDGESPGTRDSIAKARAAGRPVTVVRF